MTCDRCASMMVRCEPLRYYASTDSSEHTHSHSYRCPICGNYQDNRIALNRRLAGVQ